MVLFRMFKSLTTKFTFFFWLFFLLVTVPIYIFANYHFKNILNDSEEEKIILTINTLKPVIAFNLSFNQKEQLQEVLSNMFVHDDIQTIKLTSVNGSDIFFKSRQNNYYGKTYNYKSVIIDPFTKQNTAIIFLTYTNKHLVDSNNKIFIIIFSIFIFSLTLFSFFFIYLRKDLKALHNIADSLQEYTHKKDIQPISNIGNSKEIRTIANVANEMLSNISEYVKKLKTFNTELAKRVSEEIEKQKNQEKLMVHQSRQAAMGEMLESIAHQWRQPLNIIGLATANIETEYTLGLITKEKFHERMRIISMNINFMSDTIDDFRNFLNPGKKIDEFSAQKSIQDVLSILNAQFQNNGITYNLNINSDLLLIGIENEFKQVILILLNNSKDAIKTQIEKQNINNGSVTISFSKENDYGVIDINDNGGGIDPDIIDSIFEAYFSTKFHAHGTGIGLYIAKKIIETRMKGYLSVENVNNGTCFTIKLPIIKEDNI